MLPLEEETEVRSERRYLGTHMTLRNTMGPLKPGLFESFLKDIKT